MMSEVWRLTLQYDVAGAGPSTVIEKRSSRDPFRREIADRFGFYRRELSFYEEVAPLIAVRAPRCFAGFLDPDSGDVTLVPEDLAALRTVAQVDGASLSDALVAARWLASLHAPWWTRTQTLPGCVDVLDAPVLMTNMVETFTRSWPRCRALAGDRLPSPVVDVAERWSELWPMIASQLSSTPTLCHGDFRLDNICFDREEIVAFDWQLMIVAHGLTDLAYFVSQSVRTEERAGNDRTVLIEYLSNLRAAGVELAIDVAWDVYRLAVLAMLCFPVALYGQFESFPAAAQRTIEALLDRSVATIVDLHAWELTAAR